MNKKELILTVLSEECSEVAQRATKAIRFGLDEIQQGQKLNNAQRLVYEFNDLYAMMEILLEEGHISTILDNVAIEAKKEKFIKYMNYSIECGTVSNK